MLGSFMEDIGITSEQFENACKESKRYQVAFDPVSKSLLFTLSSSSIYIISTII